MSSGWLAVWFAPLERRWVELDFVWIATQKPLRLTVPPKSSELSGMRWAGGVV